MGTLRIETLIHAPRERCFDLSRSVDLHVRSTERSGERAVRGVVSGLMGPGDQVTWRARHLGVWQTLTSQIVRYERPARFRDSMVQGAFARFDHDHLFDDLGPDDQGRPRCLMVDVFDYDAPLGALGDLVERVFLDRYLDRFLRERIEVIRRVAESDEWQRYVDTDLVGGDLAALR